MSDAAVLKWVRAEAAALPEPEVSASVVTVEVRPKAGQTEVDEMWHFLKKSAKSGEPLGSTIWLWRAYDMDVRRTVA